MKYFPELNRKLIFYTIFIMSVIYAPYCWSFIVEEKLQNEQQEQKAREIFKNIRCVVCAGQSIADSDVELAQNIRMMIRERVKAGDSEAQITDYLVSRYGNEILFNPPLRGTTYILWAGPFIFLFIGAIAIWLYLKSSGKEKE